ncbi:MAG: glucuronate isomerase [Lentisphaerae bacterium]|nr:glucuronate isomerase [Lentisphaerota bacterium]
MKNVFIHDDFMLGTPQAARLYHDYAKAMPIVDYHCHLPPAQVACDQRWENITRIWLAGDHYKWRAMRGNGVAEKYCTGDAGDREKFAKWAATVPRLLRNPLYHWTHLELARYFGIADRLLGPDTEQGIWDECNARLAEPGFSARGLMRRSNVVLACTTDDPADSLEHHAAVARDPSFETRVLPAWRPDKAMAVEAPAAYRAYMDKLEQAAGVEIRDIDGLREALAKRHDFFHSMGCRLSDHGLETIHAARYTEKQIASAFRTARSGGAVDAGDAAAFKSAMLYEFAVMDAEKGWTQQYHFGVLRNNNSRMFAAVGPDTGFDSIGDFEIAGPMSRLFDRLDSEGRLARTILYNINPRDNELVATMCGNFQDGSVPGKIQFGSGWWFLDQKDGMERQIEALSQLGILSRFVGMLTDSRSFLSYTRHEYFRRILCNILGRDMAQGLIPSDMDLVGDMVKDICYRNAAGYFGFDLPADS